MLKPYSKKDFKEFVGSLLFFFLWPFGSLIHSLKNNKKIWAKNTFWIFCTFYGFNFVINSPGVDAYRYAEWFVSWSKYSWEFSDFISALYTTDTKSVDIFQPFLSFILSRFTDDTRILFTVFGFVFGFFYSRNLWYLFERLDTHKSLIAILFIVAFSLMIPIWLINGFRFWTAAHIYLYGVFPFLFEENKKKIWIASLSVFVHFSFIAPVIVLILYSVLGNRYKLYFVLFIFSLLINELNLYLIREQFDYLPAVFQDKSNIYLQEDVLERQVEKITATNWYIRYFNAILNWIAYIFIISLYLRARSKIKESKSILNLFSFTMLFYSFANISNLVPQGIRYNLVSAMLFFFMLICMSSVIKLPALVIKIRFLSVPFLLILIIVNIRKGLDFTGLFTIIGNPLIALITEHNIPLIDLLK